jgi:hypothetical protein
LSLRDALKAISTNVWLLAPMDPETREDILVHAEEDEAEPKPRKPEYVIEPGHRFARRFARLVARIDKLCWLYEDGYEVESDLDEHRVRIDRADLDRAIKLLTEFRDATEQRRAGKQPCRPLSARDVACLKTLGITVEVVDGELLSVQWPVEGATCG